MLQSLRTLCSSSHPIAWRFSSSITSANVGTNSRCIHSSTLGNTMHENKDAGPTTPEVLHDQRGQLAVVTLNRPKALNSLTTGMVESMLSLLTHWKFSDTVAVVLVKGAGGKAFCAGGDVKAIAQLGRSGDTSAAQRFFRSEYRMNAAIAAFPKPYIAIIDGITMGGGAGVSVHGPIRIATEKTLFAMPECAIGLFPDIGGSYFLPRLPGAVGMYLGLTGARIKGVDVLHAGIATHYMPSALLPEVERSLEGLGSAATSLHKITEVINNFQSREPLPNGTLPAMRDDIDAIFGGQRNVEEIYRACERRKGKFGKEALELLNKGSPTSQRIVYEQLRRGVDMPLEECLRMEYRIANHLAQNPGSDFYEGVDAALIRKDGEPRWSPRSLQEVSPQDIEILFAPLPPNEELQFAPRTRTKL